MSRIVDLASGANVLWSPAAAPLGALPTDLGEPGEPSILAFEQRVFAGGWFVMFPNAGLPGENPELWIHGEAAWLPWTVTHLTAFSVTASVRLSASGFWVTRKVTVAGSVVTATTTAVNVSDAARTVTYGEHPCFPRQLFAGGTLEVETDFPAAAASIAQPAAAQYRPAQEFAWPDAPLVTGGSADASRIPDHADGRHDHLRLHAAGPVRIESAGRGPTLELRYSPALRSLLIWEHYRPAGSPWDADVFAIEPASAAGRTFDEMVESGGVTTVDVGGSVAFSASITVGPPAA